MFEDTAEMCSSVVDPSQTVHNSEKLGAPPLGHISVAHCRHAISAKSHNIALLRIIFLQKYAFGQNVET